MAASSLLSLPIELLESIVVCVSKRSIKDHFSLKMTCRALRALSEYPSVYSSVNLFNLELNSSFKNAAFMKKCYDEGNPCAVYIKGCQDYFQFDKKESRLAKIIWAADKGSMVALYTYAMLRYVIWDDDTQIRKFSRESIRPISSDFVNRVRLCRPHCYDFLSKEWEIQFDACYFLAVYMCTPYDDCWEWYDDEVKGPEMCDQCFWWREYGIFAKFFGFIEHPSTVDW